MRVYANSRTIGQHVHHLVVLTILAVLGLTANASWSQTALPQPRILYEMHTALISQIRATPDFERIVSIAQDKTIRIWRASDLKLIRVIPLPSEVGDEGDPRALAINANGTEVIVGGWTGLDWHKQSQLYRFDLASGRMLETLRGFPGTIEALAMSRDNRLIAVGTAHHGIKVLRLSDRQLAFADDKYAERVTFADFSADGKLATTSADGCVRAYSPSGEILFRAEWPVRQNATDQNACTGSQLGGIRFSPDGQWLAFGVQDRPEVVLLNAQTMKVQKVITVDDPGQQSLCCIAWSPDSKVLYIDGLHRDKGSTPLYRITESGSGRIERLPVGRNHYTNLIPFPDGHLVFSTDTPSLERIDSRGQKVAETLPPNIDFRSSQLELRLSRDAKRIVLPLGSGGQNPYMFTLGASDDRAFEPAQADDLANTAPPVRNGLVAVQTETGFLGYKQPTLINGNRLSLRPFQSVWTWANHPQQPVAVLGTTWSVMMVDEKAGIRWQQVLPAPAYQVTLSQDGRWVVAAVGDGTVRWYQADSGNEALSVFLHTSGKDWVAWRPDGYYASSPRGDDFMGWLVNRGDGQTPNLYRAVQFERTLYRPDLVSLALVEGKTRSAGMQASLQEVLTTIAPPRVTIEDVARAQDGTLTVRFTAEENGRPIQEFGIYADGIPVMSAAERLPAANERLSKVTRAIKIPAALVSDTIRVEAETPVSIGVDETRLSRKPAVPAGTRGTLHVLAIGVGAFEDAHACHAKGNCPVTLNDLPNAPNDALKLADTFKQHAGLQYDRVQVSILSDASPEKPTKANIMAKLAALGNASPNDTTLVFLASHGFSHGASAAEYYFVPRDARMSDLATVLSTRPEAASSPASASSLLTASEMSDALRRVAGRRLLIIDTCHSGAADGRQNPYSLAKRSAAARVAVLSAASGNEQSYEAINAPHGAFTYSLMQGLDGGADANADGRVNLGETLDFVMTRVATNMQRLNSMMQKQDPKHTNKTQTPTLTAIPALAETVLSRTR
jgi:WD40 repeat protein